METKEQKIERLKKEIKKIEFYKNDCTSNYTSAISIYTKQIAELEQQLKELEDDTKKSR